MANRKREKKGKKERKYAKQPRKGSGEGKWTEEMKINNTKDVHKITRKQITMKRQETINIYKKLRDTNLYETRRYKGN